MKHIKVLLSLAICLLAALVCVIMLFTFDLVMRNYIENTAKNAILYALQSDIYEYFDEQSPANEEDVLTNSVEDRVYAQLLTAYQNYSLFYDSLDKNNAYYGYYSETEKKIANWCRENSLKNKLYKLNLNGSSYYLYQVEGKLIEKDGYYEPAAKENLKQGIEVVWIAYVDVSAEELIIQKVYKALIFIMLFCIVFAGFLGIVIGRIIESDQKRQKEFFENASHELKTPLMSIQGYAEGIETNVLSDNSKAAKIIISESNKMADLVDEILKLARLESGAVSMRIERIFLQEVIYTCLYKIEARLYEKGISLETDIKEVYILADLKQLETAVGNILSNALRYANKVIKISADDEKLTIYNDGEAISQDDLKHIFERFYTGKKGSTGIGMALTKEIIKRHAWSIEVKALENGTIFTIYFYKKFGKG